MQSVAPAQQPDGRDCRTSSCGRKARWLLPDAIYEEGTVSLKRGDVLLCFSDGVSEAQNSAQEFWQESEIESILRGAADGSVQHLIDRLVREADLFVNGAQQSDDMTIVSVRVL